MATTTITEDVIITTETVILFKDVIIIIHVANILFMIQTPEGKVID